MSYELRGAKRYYYSARRINGRVVKTYLGDGRCAQQAAAIVAERQRERMAQRRRDAEFQQRLVSLQGAFDQFWEPSERILHLVFMASNYHRRRGEWRRLRER